MIEEEEMGREETPVKPKAEPLKKDFAGLYLHVLHAKFESFFVLLGIWYKSYIILP